MPITQTISTLPAAGARGVDIRDVFVTKQEAFQTALTGATGFVTQINALATQANTLQTDVNAKQTAAATSETNAATSKTAAAASATAAATSATSAATSATTATTQANLAIAAYDSFDDRYLGAKATIPTLDNDGQALLTGALFYDTAAAKMKVYTGSAWILAGSSISGITATTTYTATAGQTTFNITYDVGFVHVYINGVKMTTSDFTATNGTSIVLGVGCVVNDIVECLGFGTFVVANTYTKTEADNLLVLKSPLASPTFTGTVVLPSTTSIGTVSNTEIGYLDGVTSAIQTQLGAKANLASPTFTGTPAASTAAVGTNTTQLATTQFVNSEIAGDVGVANSSLVKTALNASGSAPIYACRAWVNFNGADTVTIRASGNVSSITDNGTGDYTVNFTTAMSDANYVAVFGSRNNGDGLGDWVAEFGDPATQAGKLTTSLRVRHYKNDGTLVDNSSFSVAIFR